MIGYIIGLSIVAAAIYLYLKGSRDTKNEIEQASKIATLERDKKIEEQVDKIHDKYNGLLHSVELFPSNQGKVLNTKED